MSIRTGVILPAVFALSMLGHGNAAWSTGCSRAAIDSAIDQTAMARQVMLALPIEDAHRAEVSPAAQQAIGAIKQRLAILVNAYMRCAAVNSDTASIEHGLSRLVQAFGHKPGDENRYGYEIGFQAKRPAGHPNIVTITADFSIECGSDVVLFVFSGEAGRWREVLRWQNKPYKTISGGAGAFDYALSPSDGAGKWYLLVKSIAPSCNSFWSAIRAAALRPDPRSVTPRVLYQEEDGLWWGGEDFGEIVVKESEFDIRFHSWSIDTGILVRPWVRHFKIVGNNVARIQPVALSPRDFADEWIVSSWAEARAWSAPEKRSSLWPWHERLKKLGSASYYSIRQCSDRPDRYQVGLLAGEGQSPVFLSVEGKAAYTLTGAAAKPDPRCGGPDILDATQPQ